MSNPVRAAADALALRLRRVDEKLRIDHRDRSEWVWLGPLATVVGTVALVVVTGMRSGVAVGLYLPIALLLAVVMGGMSVAYMTPMADVGPGEDPGGGRPEQPAPSAPPWYRRLHEHTVDEPAPRERSARR